MMQNSLSTLEKYNCIKKLQIKATRSQFAHIFSLSTDVELLYMVKIPLASKVEATKCSPETRA